MNVFYRYYLLIRWLTQIWCLFFLLLSYSSISLSVFFVFHWLSLLYLERIFMSKVLYILFHPFFFLFFKLGGKKFPVPFSFITLTSCYLHVLFLTPFVFSEVLTVPERAWKSLTFERPFQGLESPWKSVKIRHSTWKSLKIEILVLW